VCAAAAGGCDVESHPQLGRGAARVWQVGVPRPGPQDRRRDRCGAGPPPPARSPRGRRGARGAERRGAAAGGRWGADAVVLYAREQRVLCVETLTARVRLAAEEESSVMVGAQDALALGAPDLALAFALMSLKDASVVAAGRVVVPSRRELLQVAVAGMIPFIGSAPRPRPRPRPRPWSHSHPSSGLPRARARALGAILARARALGAILARARARGARAWRPGPGMTSARAPARTATCGARGRALRGQTAQRGRALRGGALQVRDHGQRDHDPRGRGDRGLHRVPHHTPHPSSLPHRQPCSARDEGCVLGQGAHRDVDDGVGGVGQPRL